MFRSSFTVMVAGVAESAQRLHGQTPGAGAGLAVVNDHVSAGIALPAASLAATDTVYVAPRWSALAGVKVAVRVAAS